MPSRSSSTLDPASPAGQWVDDDAEDGSSEPPDLPNSKLQLDLTLLLSDAATHGVDGVALRAEIARLAQLAGIKAGELSVVVVHDDRMAELHEAYQNVAGTTDVLTFDLSVDDAEPGVIDAELVLCLDEAHRQAARRGHSVQLELLLYAVHGMLHLFGHDDQSADDARRMHDREDELLTAAGFGAVYARELKDEHQASGEPVAQPDDDTPDALPAATSAKPMRRGTRG